MISANLGVTAGPARLATALGRLCWAPRREPRPSLRRSWHAPPGGPARAQPGKSPDAYPGLPLGRGGTTCATAKTMCKNVAITIRSYPQYVLKSAVLYIQFDLFVQGLCSVRLRFPNWVCFHGGLVADQRADRSAQDRHTPAGPTRPPLLASRTRCACSAATSKTLQAWISLKNFYFKRIRKVFITSE